MGYDMYMIKVDKNKVRNLEEPLWQEIQVAMIDEVNSYYPVLRNFYQDHDELHWTYEEYNILSETILTKMVYENIKDWIPLKENEIVYFEEDS